LLICAGFEICILLAYALIRIAGHADEGGSHDR
jgi:hypothetical protein